VVATKARGASTWWQKWEFEGKLPSPPSYFLHFFCCKEDDNDVTVVFFRLFLLQRRRQQQCRHHLFFLFFLFFATNEHYFFPNITPGEMMVPTPSTFLLAISSQPATTRFIIVKLKQEITSKNLINNMD
jgi:hypothetical protein